MSPVLLLSSLTSSCFLNWYQNLLAAPESHLSSRFLKWVLTCITYVWNSLPSVACCQTEMLIVACLILATGEKEWLHYGPSRLSGCYNFAVMKRKFCPCFIFAQNCTVKTMTFALVHEQLRTGNHRWVACIFPSSQFSSVVCYLLLKGNSHGCAAETFWTTYMDLKGREMLPCSHLEARHIEWLENALLLSWDSLNQQGV